MTDRTFKIFRLFMAGYFIALGLSGIIMELALVSPWFAGLPYPFYPAMKAVHRNIYLYGIVLNLVAAFLMNLVGTFGGPNGLTDEKNGTSANEKAFRVWLAIQAGLIFGLILILFRKTQSPAWMEMEFVPDLILFGAFVSLIFLYVKKILKTENKSSVQYNIATRYFLTPVGVFLFYFIFLNLVRPAGLFSSAPLISAMTLNILETGLWLYIEKYFFAMVVFGILFRMVQDADDDQFFYSIRRQWILHTVLFSVNLYYELEAVGNRQESVASIVSGAAALMPWILGVLILKYSLLKQERARNQSDLIIFRYVIMFIWIYVLGEIGPAVFNFTDVLAFTDWQSAQSHLLAAGIVLPVAWLVLKSPQPPEYHWTKNTFVTFWLFSVIAIVATGWITGVFQAAWIQKSDFWGFFENPGWRSVTAQLHPYRLARFCFELILVAYLAFYLLTKRTGFFSIKNKSNLPAFLTSGIFKKGRNG